MGWFAAAIPIVTSVLGAMGDDKDKQQPQGPVAPPPPTLGEIFAKNADNYASPTQYAMPNTNPFISNSPVGGGQR
jgi:hypothetical protein